MITSTGGGAVLKLTAVRFQATNSNSSSAPPPPDGHNLQPPSPPPSRTPLLSVPKPSWIVKTESNVRLEKRRKPDPSCVVCIGSGRVDCFACSGKGRTNGVDLAMLPNGDWPKWCKTCGGSGLAYCSRCLGTGEYRYLMGFHFMKKDEGEGGENYKVRDMLRARKSADDLLPNDEIS
ncbi:hypothetical protein SSX86_004836 [Deinandra increscens subsp. villosa]|uniref:Uncharacterized protein n=1 Tax=Deinandra increscens subsp. villosa TaxID=3103831 RepID=A0AAP0DPS4_9ASTR